MSLFRKKPSVPEPVVHEATSPLADMALSAIREGVIIADQSGIVSFINPAAIQLSGIGDAENSLGFSYDTTLKIVSLSGNTLSPAENLLARAIQSGQPLDNFRAGLLQGTLVGGSEKVLPVSLSVVIDNSGNRIVTFRDISREIAEESEKSDFISTASHEMRTPVATIDGYLALALNPRTATIDERARGYLNSAHAASQHLGELFQSLLDVTKLEDGLIKPKLVPVELVGLVKQISESYAGAIKNAHLNLIFGAQRNSSFSEVRRVEQVVYGSVDLDFMRLILGNLLENAIKYTPAGGSIYVNVSGSGDRVNISISDTGIGISAEDLAHIFERFYRADNSDTRTIGGTGLGLYLVKQRVEAMNGSVSAESVPGKGSVFTVSLPRLTSDEYEKRMIAFNNTLGGQK